MKLKNLILLVAAALTTASVNAQILWKVEKPGNDHVSYLLGTHHFAPSSVLDEIEELPGIINNTDILYGELDMQEMTKPENLQTIQMAMIAPADSAINKILTPQQLDSLQSYWDSLSGGEIPLDLLFPLKPAALSSQITALVSQKVLPQINPLEGIDKIMQERALSAGKKVGSLESLDFQMNLLFGLPISKQAEGLLSTIRDKSEEEKVIKLTEAYMKHDINTILALTEAEEADDPEMLDYLLYSRNKKWTEFLQEAMKNQNLLVVVGAGHLPGSKGVIEGLRNQGYTITPVK